MRVGERVRVRFVGSNNNFVHPMHIHGGPFRIVQTDGNPLPPAAQIDKDTVNVGPGERYDVIWVGRAERAGVAEEGHPAVSRQHPVALARGGRRQRDGRGGRRRRCRRRRLTEGEHLAVTGQQPVARGGGRGVGRRGREPVGNGLADGRHGGIELVAGTGGSAGVAMSDDRGALAGAPGGGGERVDVVAVGFPGEQRLERVDGG
jgi:hypothetical protein